MIDEKHFMGRDGFYWFVGKVVDRNDTKQLGRVKVRIFGIHPDSEKKEGENYVPDDHLPWAIPVQPVTSAGVFGVGQSPTGLLVGSYVLGFFIDGQDAQIPVVLGSIASSLGHYVYQAIDSIKDTAENAATALANAAGDAAQVGPPVNSGPPNQEFWTLVALCACEAGTNGQDQCDIAQTLYNRAISGAYGKNSVLGIILTPGQYQPVWSLPANHGPYKYGPPNEYWLKINDANSAAAATGKFSASQMLQFAANLRNPNYQAESKRFVGARTDFLGVGQPATNMTNNGSKVQRSDRSNKIGFSYRYKGAKGVSDIPSFVTNQSTK
jgi:hypothetical protein